MGDNDFRPCGDHWVRIEGDLILMRVKGVVRLGDMKEMFQLQAQVRRTHGRVFVLYDSRENTGLEPAARKFATDTIRPETRMDAAASFGASFGMRVVVNMINRALDALGKDGARTMLFETEAEARQYLDTERRRLQSPVAA